MSESRDPDPNPLREGLSRRKNPDPATIVLFGATGDLTRRKLVPALFNLKQSGLLPAKFAVIGFARREKSDEEFRAEMLAAVREHGALGEDGGDGASVARVWDEFAASLFYHASSFEDPEGYRALGRRLEETEQRLGLPPNRLFYLAAGPEHFSPIVKRLHETGLTRGAPGKSGGWARVVVEKPFGRDLASAQALNRELLGVLDESQVFRIDHYLGKETVQNLLALRFANGIFEPLWNQKYVDHVQITVAETVGVEGRGGYYDTAGALRDMVENQLLQVLALTAMEPPVAVEADAIRDEKVKVLRALRRVDPGNVDRFAVRGQYGAGDILGRAVPAYVEEKGVPRDSRTETYVALRVEIENWRWAGTPFFLRTGKHLPKRSTEVCIQFRKPPLHLFGGEAACQAAPNALIVDIQPDEGISLRFGAKAPGPDIEVRQVKMDFRYGTSFGTPSPEAYERLLLDALAGDSTLFTRRDEVEAAWAFVSDILTGWERSRLPPHPYPAGTWGPEEASRLFHGAAGSWRRL